MKIQIIRSSLLFLLSICFLSSCNSDEENKNEKCYLTSILKNSRFHSSFNYTEDNQPLSLVNYVNESISSILSFEYENKILRHLSVNLDFPKEHSDSTLIPESSSFTVKVDYDAHNLISKITFKHPIIMPSEEYPEYEKGKLVKVLRKTYSSTFEYNERGLISKEVISELNSGSEEVKLIREYEYDSNPAWNKTFNLPFSLLGRDYENLHPIFSPQSIGKNNITKIISRTSNGVTKTITREFEYNLNNYPSKMIESDEDGNKSFWEFNYVYKN